MSFFFPLLIRVAASGLVGLIQPMLWEYTPNLDVDKTGGHYILWESVFKHSKRSNSLKHV